jgi:hypothetical protein
MKRLLLPAALSIVAMLIPSIRSHGPAAVAATPTPAALQYDEISRMAMPPATPAPPGSFQSDYQTIMSGAGKNENSGNDLQAYAEEVMARMREGKLTRYAYYKGWIRTDDPVKQTAVIEKCQEHQYISLDLAKKTYKTTDTQPPCPTPKIPHVPMMGNPGPQPQEQPGTVDMTMSGTSKDLGPLTIDSISTVGSDSSVSMAMTNAQGSCQNGSFAMTQEKYVSQIRVPRPYCPLPKTMTTGGMMSQGRMGGCEPRMHFSGSGTSMMNDLDRLVMYTRMEFGAQARGMAMVVERGNVKWFSGADADALFTIPPGFAQAQ